MVFTSPLLRRAGIVATLLLLAGCAYQPPLAGDHTLVKYKGDLKRCRDQAHVAVVQAAGKTPWTELQSIFWSRKPEHEDVLKCMLGKGYQQAA